MRSWLGTLRLAMGHFQRQQASLSEPHQLGITSLICLIAAGFWQQPLQLFGFLLPHLGAFAFTTLNYVVQ